MKPTQILAASVALVAISQAAFAANVTVRVTGSSAFRTATSNAIKNVLTSPTVAYQGNSWDTANFQIFKGSITGVGSVTIKTNWTGSVAGIQSTSNDLSIIFFPDATTGSAIPGTSLAAPTVVDGVPDVTLADNLQTSTNFNTNTLDGGGVVGIIPFAFVAAKNTAANVTNITTQAAKALLSAGSLPASVFSGNPADTQSVFAFGRDQLSGTRVITLSETGYGVGTGVTQRKPGTTTGTSPNQVASTLVLHASGGNSGESSGGTLADTLRYDFSTTTNPNGGAAGVGAIGYLGEADSYRAVYGLSAGVNKIADGGSTRNARYLSYNGVNPFAGEAKKPTGASAVQTPGEYIQLTSGSLNDTSNLVVGQVVAGDFITGGSTIQSIDVANNRIVLDKPLTGNGTLGSTLQIGALLPKFIRNGSYTFWGFEYIGWKTTKVNSTSATQLIKDKGLVAAAVQARITDFDFGYSGLANDTAQKVTRDDDGAFVYPNGN